MRSLLSIPVLLLVMIFQSAVLSRLTLLSGAADLMLLVLAAWSLQKQVPDFWQWGLVGGSIMAFVSGIPLPVPFAGYLMVILFGRIAVKRVWENPILSMFLVTFFGTLLFHLLSFAALRFTGSPLPFDQSFSLITLPTVLLNILLAVPVHSLVRDLAAWVYPVETL